MKKLLGFVLAVLLGFGLAGGLFMHAPTLNPDSSTDDIQSDTTVDEGGGNESGNENNSGGEDNGGDDTGNVGGGDEEPPQEEPKEPEEVVEPVYEWQLCKDYTQLAVGDKVIFVAEAYDIALGTEQNSSNRGEGVVLKDGDMVAMVSDVQVITLEAGALEDTFAFWVETGYLYAPSSSSNQLKTRSVLDENASWKFIVQENYGLQIIAQGASTRNILRYNQKSNLFSCYESMASQFNVLVYKLVEIEGGEMDE